VFHWHPINSAYL